MGAALVCSKDNVVSSVLLTPLERPCSYRDAITEVRQLLRKAGVAPGATAWKDIENWAKTEERSKSLDATTGGEIGRDLSFFVAVKHLRHDEWFIQFDLTIIDSEDWPRRDP